MKRGSSFRFRSWLRRLPLLFFLFVIFILIRSKPSSSMSTSPSVNRRSKERLYPQQAMKTELLTTATLSADPEFRAAVMEAFEHTWKGYKGSAWGTDELKPISRGGSNWPVKSGQPGLGLTIVEALDTLWLMNLKSDFNEAARWVIVALDFDKDMEVSVFETTIRLLGGLISAYDLSGKEGLLSKAVDLANRLAPAFNTPSGIPHNFINLRTGEHRSAYDKGSAILAEFGSIQLEFRRLAKLTGNVTYDEMVTKGMSYLGQRCRGLCSKYYLPDGTGTGTVVGVGAFGDSYYEYLLKQHLLTKRSEEKYALLWKAASQAIIETSTQIGKYTVPLSLYPPNGLEHLACFVGGLFALSYMNNHIVAHLTYAEHIAEMCHDAYMSSRTKIGAEVVRVSKNGEFIPIDTKYILRPEVAETYFYLWRVTGNAKYRMWGSDMLQAFNNVLKIPSGGYSGTYNVNGGKESLND
eukprot:PhF_6_TR33586/c0_g1_i1/m.49024/K01230/MAN1; mannosyl-oligosaccharide alpha-1,2-mannosidase